MKLPSVMRKPLVGKGLPAKQPALSLMKEKSPIRQMSPDRTRLPAEEPVRMETPCNATTCPTVGANCRGGITADAIGWLKLWARIGVGESGEGVSVQETLMKKQARTSKKQEQE